MAVKVIVRGGGDLASGVILRLHRAGFFVLVVELPHPMAVRRLVSFSEAIHEGQFEIEGTQAVKVEEVDQAGQIWQEGKVPVLVDPSFHSRTTLKPQVIVDGRMIKKPPELGKEAARLVIGLGPGFTAGRDCHAVIETQRGPFMGRVIWNGSALPDTGIPERVGDQQVERVLRAPEDGKLQTFVGIGDKVNQGVLLYAVNGVSVAAPFAGVIRGLLPAGRSVVAGLKIGDLDPRGDPNLARMISDKSLAVGGGVLEAILSQADLRQGLRD